MVRQIATSLVVAAAALAFSAAASFAASQIGVASAVKNDVHRVTGVVLGPGAVGSLGMGARPSAGVVALASPAGGLPELELLRGTTARGSHFLNQASLYHDAKY